MLPISDPVREFLEARHYATLATQNPDGSIHLTPVWYLFENGKFYVELRSTSRKARNAAARPKATILIDVRKPGEESWVHAAGRVEILSGEKSRQINSRIKQRYLTEAAITDPFIGPVFAASDDRTMCLVPETWRSWKAKDADERKFGGMLSRNAEKWFYPMDD